MEDEFCGMLEGELIDIVQGGSGGVSYYPDLVGLPSINGVTLVGNKSGEDLGLASKGDIPSVDDFATKGELPTKVSQLENDAGYLKEMPGDYVTEAELQGKGYASESYVDAKVAELVNSAPDTLNTLGELASAIEGNKDLIDAIKVPTKTSELTNDSGFITAEDIPQQDVDLSNYYTKSETESYVANQGFATKGYVDSLVGDINTALENVLGV